MWQRLVGSFGCGGAEQAAVVLAAAAVRVTLPELERDT